MKSPESCDDSVATLLDVGKSDISVVSGLTYAKLIEGGLGGVATRIVFVEQHYNSHRLFRLTYRLRPGKRWLKGIQSCIVLSFEAKVCLQLSVQRGFCTTALSGVCGIAVPGGRGQGAANSRKNKYYKKKT